MIKIHYSTLPILLSAAVFATDNPILTDAEIPQSPRQEEVIQEELSVVSIYEIINNKIRYNANVSKESLQKLFEEEFHKSENQKSGCTRYSTFYEESHLTYATPTDIIKIEEFESFKFIKNSLDYGHGFVFIPIQGIKKTGETFTFRIMVKEKSNSPQQIQPPKEKLESSPSTSPKPLLLIPTQKEQQELALSPRKPVPFSLQQQKVEINPEKIKAEKTPTSPKARGGSFGIFKKRDRGISVKSEEASSISIEKTPIFPSSSKDKDSAHSPHLNPTQEGSSPTFRSRAHSKIETGKTQEQLIKELKEAQEKKKQKDKQ